ncbi:unnamed protein product [Calicophoron daubneyi]|uniref:General transcription factor IIF subunit 1 n=1 Tax=Calicophoron daubneyi TaxID=300641 RepID=A0AAV2TAV6_CALDB
MSGVVRSSVPGSLAPTSKESTPVNQPPVSEISQPTVVARQPQNTVVLRPATMQSSLSNSPSSVGMSTSSNSPVVLIRSISTTPGTNSSVSNSSGASLKIMPVGPHPVKISSVVSPATMLRPNSSSQTASAKSIPSRPLLVNPPVPVSSKSHTVPPDVKKNEGDVKKEPGSAAQSSNATVQRNIIREMQVRVPNRRDKRFSVLRFHTSDRPDLSSGLEVFMQRENNLKQYRTLYNLGEMPDRGAGSEFGREAKEEARLKKFGVIREGYKPDDQPWVMTVGKGRTGRRRYKGMREGSVSENVEYFVFCQCKDGNFDAYPIHAWYKMNPEISYRFLREDEAEAAYSRLNSTKNYFNVMIKRRLTDETEEEASVDREIGKELKYLSVATENRSAPDAEGAALSKSAAQRLEGGLKLTDLEEVGSGSEADDDEEEDEEGSNDGSETPKAGSSKRKNSMFSEVTPVGGRPKVGPKVPVTAAERARMQRKKQRDAAIVSRMRRHVKKRKKRVANPTSSSEDDDLMDEARDDSEVDDHEGDEVDYMTNSSSDEEKLSDDEREKIYEETGVADEEGLKALLTDISSEEESEGNDEKKNPREDETVPEDSNLEDDPGRNNKVRDSTGVEKTETEGDQEHRSHRSRKKQPKGEEDGLSGSSSSSSSVDGESSTYSSSSSDSEVDEEDKAKRNAKKAAVLQKLSASIHSSTNPPYSSSSSSATATGTATVCDSVDSGTNVVGGVKRRPTDSMDSGTTGSPSSMQPPMKKERLDTSAGTNSASASDSELMNTVRKYLMRKPITVTELLKKIRLRKLVGKNEDAQTALANVLRQLRPIKQIINGQHALSLKH